MESDSHPNPYQPPRSAIEHVPVLVKKPVYSPAQAAFGTFLGGPLAGLYFLKSNYDAMKDGRGSKLTSVWGAVSLLAFVLLAPFTPERIPKFIFPLAMSWVIRLLVEKGQFSKEHIQSSAEYCFQSNWKVVGLSLVGTLILGAAVVGTILLYDSAGILPDA